MVKLPLGFSACWFFFDDYANTVLLGKTLQPLCDRLKISREKLAYLVDSTAAPVAGLAIISTWVAGEISFVQDGLNNLPDGDQVNAFSLFINSIPYRFYALWALVFVFVIGISNRDFGPMLTAERKVFSQDAPDLEDQSNVPIAGWWNAVIPITATVMCVLALMIQTGYESLSQEGTIEGATAWQIFGAANSYFALLWGSFAGLTIAIAMVLLQRLLSFQQVNEAMATGAKLMISPLVVLWLASTLSTMTGNGTLEIAPNSGSEHYPAQEYRLYTGDYLAGLITNNGQESTPTLTAWLPTIIFLLSACISFSTGTSWGTMAIVMPIAIPLAYGAIAEPGSMNWQHNPIMISAVGSVLAGSIFGDHCSPHFRYDRLVVPILRMRPFRTCLDANPLRVERRRPVRSRRNAADRIRRPGRLSFAAGSDCHRGLDLPFRAPGRSGPILQILIHKARPACRFHQ